MADRLKWKKEPLSLTERVLASNGAHRPPHRWLLQSETATIAIVARTARGFDWWLNNGKAQGAASTVERAKDMARDAVRAGT